ncbi:unnamed protein product [Closterium sp. NIES-54]
MNHILRPLLDECVVVYLDDILIYSRDMKQHIEHLRRVFEILRREKLYVKLSKSEFALKKVQFLGHMVSAQGVHVDPKKIEAVRTWKTPESVKELQQFLGFANYYNWFVPQYAKIATPLTNLLKKNTPFKAGGTPATTGSGGACPGGAGAAGPGGTTEAAGVGPTGGSPGATGATGVGAAGGVGVGGSADAGASEGSGAGAAGAGGATDAGAPAGSPGAVPAGSGDAPRPRPYFVPLLEQVLGLPPSPGPAPPFDCPQPVQSQSLLQPVSPLPTPSPYTGPTGGVTERRAPASRPASPARPACTSRRTSSPRPPAVPGTHQMALRPSTAPLRVPLPSPPVSSLPALPDPESDSLCAASPTVARFLATVVTDPSLASTAASALVAELVDFAARCRLDYAASLVAESASVCPPSVGGDCALSTDVLEDRQEEFQCFAAALPHLVSTLLAPEGDPDAPDIPTPRSYAEAIEGPYSSQWQAAMDAEMASWKSTGTYVDEVPPPGAIIVFLLSVALASVAREPVAPVASGSVAPAARLSRGACHSSSPSPLLR